MDAEVWGEVGRDVVKCCGAGRMTAKEQFHSPFFWGEIQEFDKSTFNPFKSPRQLEANRHLG